MYHPCACKWPSTVIHLQAQCWQWSGNCTPSFPGQHVFQFISVCPVVLLSLADEISRTSWRHQMEVFSALLAFCEGNVHGLLSQRPGTRNFDVFFDLHLNKRLSKQPRRWWSETPSRSLWRHCNFAALWVLIKFDLLQNVISCRKEEMPLQNVMVNI